MCAEGRGPPPTSSSRKGRRNSRNSSGSGGGGGLPPAPHLGGESAEAGDAAGGGGRAPRQLLRAGEVQRARCGVGDGYAGRRGLVGSRRRGQRRNACGSGTEACAWRRRGAAGSRGFRSPAGTSRRRRESAARPRTLRPRAGPRLARGGGAVLLLVLLHGRLPGGRRGPLHDARPLHSCSWCAPHRVGGQRRPCMVLDLRSSGAC